MTNETPQTSLPPFEEMYEALCERNSEYEGVFFVGVKTTGIFCRPTCPARKPKASNVDFYRTTADALSAGFRACKRCRPMENSGETPQWLRSLLDAIETDPNRRWLDADLAAIGIPPSRARRWFKTNHSMTFHAYLRSRRLANAMGQISTENKNTTEAALDCGYQSLSGFREAFKNWFGSPPIDSKLHTPPITMSRILTPLGPMVVATTVNKVCLLEFADRRMLETQLKRVQKAYRTSFTPKNNELIKQLESELKEYFKGTRTEFEVPIEAIGTEFQESVWNQLLKIPPGKTASYESIARGLKKPGAQRAVGRANGDNRIAIIIPCHRVIRNDGTLSGYGGGVWRKKWLLEHEQKASRLF